MKPAALHIICLDAPSPPNYGGAIDMYYKIRALALAGTRIILHYFAYREGRGNANACIIPRSSFKLAPFL